MASQTHEIAFKLASKMSGGFSQTFAAAQKAVAGFNKSVADINAKASDTSKILQMRRATGEAAREYYNAQQRAQELGRAIAATDEPTAEMTREFEKARQAVQKARNELNKKRTALHEVEAAAGTAGESIQTLIQREKKLKAAAEQAADAQSKLAKGVELQNKFKGMISSSAMALGGIAAAAAPVGLAIKQAMDFEDMQAELGKYSDESKEIFTGIKNLTGKYSKSAQDMTDMAANAMQAGIARTKEEVLTLVESQTQAAVAFGMTGDAVGSAWADIQSKMQTSVGETKAVFDIVNKLGNETSASSADILNVLQRQGGAVKAMTALNEKQITALAGAFRSASVSSEVAATSMGTFFSRLTAGGKTKKQSEAFEKLGLDAKEMAKRMTSSSESAQTAIQDIFTRINKLSDEEKGSVIGDLFGEEAGIKSAVLTLSANANMLGNNLKVAGDKTSYTGSMLKEYAARANTTSEYMGILRNQITLIGANLGQALLPAVKSATQSLISIGQKVATFAEKNQGLVTTIAKVGAVVLGGVAAFHAMRLAIGLIGYPIMSLYNGFQAYRQAVGLANAAMAAGQKATLGQKAALLAHAAATKISAAAQWVLNSAFWACPITWIVAGIIALVAVGVLLYKNWDKVKAGAVALWNAAVNCFNSIKTKVTELWQAFQQKFPMISRIVQIAMLPVKIAIQSVIIIFKLLKAAGIALWNGLKWCWNGIKSVTVSAWNKIQQPLMNAWNKFKQFAGYVKTQFVSAFQGFRDKVSGIFSGLVGIVKGPMNAVIGLVNKAIGAINKINVKIPEWAGGGNIGFNIAKIPQLATGGIATQATPAIIGEGREPEAVLPLSYLDRMLSARSTTPASGGSTSGGGITVNFNPTINVSGGSGDVAGDVRRGINAGLDDLERAIEAIMRKKHRLAY